MRIHIVTALIGIFLASALAASAQTGTIPPGTKFSGTLAQSISSKTANVGDPVTLNNVSSSDGQVVNARLLGHVASVTRAGQGRNAQIQLEFDTLQIPNGPSYPISAEVTDVQVNTANNGAKEAAGALGGMILGNILGKWMGTNLGGAIGAAGGYVIAKNNKADVTIPSNSSVAVRVTQPHPQQQYPYGQPPPNPQQPYRVPQTETTPLPR